MGKKGSTETRDLTQRDSEVARDLLERLKKGEDIDLLHLTEKEVSVIRIAITLLLIERPGSIETAKNTIPSKTVKRFRVTHKIYSPIKCSERTFEIVQKVTNSSENVVRYHRATLTTLACIMDYDGDHPDGITMSEIELKSGYERQAINSHIARLRMHSLLPLGLQLIEKNRRYRIVELKD